MGLSRRKFLSWVALSILPSAALAWIRGRPAPTRILIIGYGQSNMGFFFTNADANVPPTAPNTFFYDGSTITTVPAANGIRQLQNSVTTATGLPTLSINASQGGSPSASFLSGQQAFNNAVAQINAVIQPTDECFIIWDQGEGDAVSAPPVYPDFYARNLNQIHTDLVAAVGRTKATCPWLGAGLGTSSISVGSMTGGQTDLSWQTIKNALVTASLTGSHMYWSHTNMDFVRAPGDGYHYIAASDQLMGARFAQSISYLMGFSTGLANWSISTAAVVDATHTNVNVVHNLGTDFTPTSGGNGWEVSGNNGATWITATASRISATQISLLHGSITITNARLVRYLWGSMPPNSSGSTPPTAMIFDNSPLAIPLSPTTWNLRPTPLSTLPMPTWRDVSVAGPSGTTQSVSSLALGPENQRKFIIFSLSGNDFSLNPILQIKITPKDYLGNNVGTAIVQTSPTAIVAQGVTGIYSALLGADASAATSFQFDLTLTSFAGNSVIQVWTVPFADLNSTTPTGNNKSTALSSVSGTTTLNVSAGGFGIMASHNTVNATSQVAMATASSSTGEAYGTRWENPSGIHTASGDAANSAGNAASAVTITYADSGTIDVVAAAWR
jgi:hypothetical protein